MHSLAFKIKYAKFISETWQRKIQQRKVIRYLILIKTVNYRNENKIIINYFLYINLIIMRYYLVKVKNKFKNDTKTSFYFDKIKSWLGKTKTTTS